MSTKIVLAFIALFSITVACSKDEIRTDTIIGTWQMSKMGHIQNGVTVDTSTDCDKKSTITFTNTGGVTNSFFYNELETNNCIQSVDKEGYSGRWKRKSDTNYLISYENRDGSGYEYGMSSVIFPDNDTMYFNYSDGMGGEETDRDEYIRIE